MNESKFSVRQLTEMYNTTKTTIHAKLTHPDVKNYVTRQENKVYLDAVGLNALNIIMANSNVALRQNNDNITTNPTELTDKIGPNYQELYIENLKEQIEQLRQENENLNQRVDFLTKGIFEKKMLPEPKRNWNPFRRN